jgi:hypothetical protein
MPDTPLQYFSTWLAQHRRGELDAEIAAALADVAGAAQQTGKSGSVTIVLSLKPNPNSDRPDLVERAVFDEVVDEVAAGANPPAILRGPAPS